MLLLLVMTKNDITINRHFERNDNINRVIVQNKFFYSNHKKRPFMSKEMIS